MVSYARDWLKTPIPYLAIGAADGKQISTVRLRRMRPGITPCVTKPAATYAAATPQFHSPAASADA